MFGHTCADLSMEVFYDTPVAFAGIRVAHSLLQVPEWRTECRQKCVQAARRMGEHQAGTLCGHLNSIKRLKHGLGDLQALRTALCIGVRQSQF